MQADAQWVEALRQRDPDALAALFEKYADRIFRLAVGLLRDEVEADGVVQHAFLTLIRRAHEFEGRSNVGTWLYRVAYNECIGRLRAASRIVALDEDDSADAMPTCLIDWQQVPEQILEGAEANAEMERAIAGLKPDLRAVFLLRDVEQLSTEETAQALGINPGTVKVRLHRARLALRERLALYFDEWVRA